MNDVLSPNILPDLTYRAAAPKVGQGQTAAQARKAADDFESFFIAQTMESMFAGIKTDGPFDGGHAEEMFRSMLSQEYGKTMVRAGGIGIADQVYREMLKTQELK
jgi:Rod binding domain-containing protein